MPMFVTFYSFKGGVGRTLALANVATRLAQDHREPCKVLVWDFDLAAPGLQQVFRVAGGSKHAGFVEFVYNYVNRAQIGDVSQYIRRTEIPGVDILPAGAMNRDYAAKLDQIHWREIYDKARGFDFLEAVKKQISDLPHSYDYILIDSLTGYSDVGGICVNQLPDVVVLLLRLNQQNLTGISKVYRGILDARENHSRKVTVVPVISPAWPFASPEADEWLRKAQSVFAGNEVLSISFEGSLTFGEAVISKKYSPERSNLRIVEDYERLTNKIRSLNTQDLRTIYNNVDDLRDENQFKDALKACAQLVTRRPQKEEYWRELSATVLLAPKLLRRELMESAEKILSDEAKRDNAFALIARAELTDGLEGDWKTSIEDLGRAIATAPEILRSYMLRASIYRQHGRFSEATDDYTRVINLRDKPDGGFFLSSAHVQRGYCAIRLGKLADAVKDFDAAIMLEPTDSDWLVGRAMVNLLLHKYDEAESDARKALELAPTNTEALTLGAHLLAIKGETQAAKEQIERVRSFGVPTYGVAADIAEQLLILDPREAIDVLDLYSEATGVYNALFSFLRFAAEVLLGNTSVTADPAAVEKLRNNQFLFPHLREFLYWSRQRELIPQSTANLISNQLNLIEILQPESLTDLSAQAVS